MEFTPEDRDRIYNEEKARRESEQQQSDAPGEKPKSGRGCLALIGMAVVFMVVVSKDYDHPSPGSSSSSTPASKELQTANQSRAAFTARCESVFLDIGFDVKCSVVDNEKLMISGAKMDRVVTHRVLLPPLIKAIRSAGFNKVEFWDGGLVGGYSQTFDLTSAGK